MIARDQPRFRKKRRTLNGDLGMRRGTAGERVAAAGPVLGGRRSGAGPAPGGSSHRGGVLKRRIESREGLRGTRGTVCSGAEGM